MSCIFLSLRVFGLLSSFLLLFPQPFGRYVLWPSSGVCQTREPTRNFVGRRTYRLKRCGNNNEDEENCPKTHNDKNHQASSKKFRQLMSCIVHLIKKHDILSQSVKMVHKLFHKTNRLIAAVENLHFSGVGKWSTRDKFAHTCCSLNWREKRSLFRLVSATKKI